MLVQRWVLRSVEEEPTRSLLHWVVVFYRGLTPWMCVGQRHERGSYTTMSDGSTITTARSALTTARTDS